MWNTFLCETGAVEEKEYRRRNQDFYEQYRDEQLDIDAYLRFAFEAISNIPPSELEKMHKKFMEQYVEPAITSAALELVDKHRNSSRNLSRRDSRSNT